MVGGSVGYSAPAFRRPTSIGVSGQSLEGNGVGARSLQGTAWASTAWPVADLVVLSQFELKIPTRFRCLTVPNGTVVSGNFDIGIYDNGAGTSTVNRLVSTGSTAQAGTSARQSVTIDLSLNAGTYYLALCFDNTTATVFSKTSAAALVPQAAGYAQVANGSVVLGTTLTLAAYAQTVVPLFGAGLRTGM